ncbi:MAG: SRPBCC family protein [Pseudomonadota bacterium]
MRLEHTVRVNAKAADIWTTFNDWGGVWRYQPWVVTSPLLSSNNEGVGASRRCEFVDKTSIVETITKIDVGQRIDMILSETPKPMMGGTGSIILSPKGKQTDVTVVMDIKLGLGPLNPIMGNLMMKPMMRNRITKMLESLEYHLETGGKIDSKGIKHPHADTQMMVAQ